VRIACLMAGMLGCGENLIRESSFANQSLNSAKVVLVRGHNRFVARLINTRDRQRSRSVPNAILSGFPVSPFGAIMGHAQTCPPHQDHLSRCDPARSLADTDGCSCRTSPRNEGGARAGRQPAEQPGGCAFPGGTEPGVLAGSRALVWWAVSSALVDRMRDPYIREKFTREHGAARRQAKEYFERYPKDRYQTEVESWRHLQSSNIEFTMKRLREPIESSG
jgi:hypothetical protein